MEKSEFLNELDELIKRYDSLETSDVEAELFKEEMFELVLRYKGGDE